MTGRIIILAMALVVALAGAGTLAAQTTTPSLSAPLPAQIFAAKKIFISNASGETVIGAGASELTYNGFYAQTKAWGRYDLESAPADADLIFEIRYETPLGPANSGTSSEFPQIRLAIFDPKTHVVLWAFCEPIVSTKHKSNQEHLDETLTNLVNDVKNLVAPAR
jgi:hypothetical protein